MKISEIQQIQTGVYLPKCSLFVKTVGKSPKQYQGKWKQTVKLTDSLEGVNSRDKESKQITAEFTLPGNIPLVRGCELNIENAKMDCFTNEYGTFPKLIIEGFNVVSSNEPPPPPLRQPADAPQRPSGGRREEKPDWDDINRGKCRSLVIEALIASGQLKINNDFPLDWIARAANVMMTGEDTALFNDAPPLKEDPEIPF